jgi:predicted transcriptional regulator
MLFTIFKLNDEKLMPVKAFLVNGINQTFIEQLLHGKPVDIERNNTLIHYKELIDEGLILKEQGNQYRISVQ